MKRYEITVGLAALKPVLLPAIVFAITAFIAQRNLGFLWSASTIVGIAVFSCLPLLLFQPTLTLPLVAAPDGLRIGSHVFPFELLDEVQAISSKRTQKGGRASNVLRLRFRQRRDRIRFFWLATLLPPSKDWSVAKLVSEAFREFQEKTPNTPAALLSKTDEQYRTADVTAVPEERLVETVRNPAEPIRVRVAAKDELERRGTAKEELALAIEETIHDSLRPRSIRE